MEVVNVFSGEEVAGIFLPRAIWTYGMAVFWPSMLKKKSGLKFDGIFREFKFWCEFERVSE
jgi:hypothetical protein